MSPPNEIRKCAGDSKNAPGTTATPCSRRSRWTNGPASRPSRKRGKAIVARDGTHSSSGRPRRNAVTSAAFVTRAGGPARPGGRFRRRRRTASRSAGIGPETSTTSRARRIRLGDLGRGEGPAAAQRREAVRLRQAVRGNEDGGQSAAAGRAPGQVEIDLVDETVAPLLSASGRPPRAPPRRRARRRDCAGCVTTTTRVRGVNARRPGRGRGRQPSSNRRAKVTTVAPSIAAAAGRGS